MGENGTLWSICFDRLGLQVSMFTATVANSFVRINWRANMNLIMARATSSRAMVSAGD